MSKPTVRMSITLPLELATAIRALARREHRTPSQQLEKILAATMPRNVVIFPSR